MSATGATVGVSLQHDLVAFGVYSRNATRVDLYLYDSALGAAERGSYRLARGPHCIWTISLPLAEIRESGISGTIYYGYRAWGPNWPWDAGWRTGGSPAGFVTDVDNRGNRFNPNKLLIDPYARELSHDPQPRLSNIDPNEYECDYYSGHFFRETDTGMIAPKGIVLPAEETTGTGTKPRRPLKDDVIYECHLRGLTKLDRQIPAELRGTFRGAALKAEYLAKLGVTAVQFLPVQAFANEQNDDGIPPGDNYWGYMTLNYFSPNRRYAADRSPGGPTREFKEMVRAFHEHGIKVFLDVVYNHSAEGLLRRMSDRDDDSRGKDARQDPECACLLSLRGLDNASYYQLRSNAAPDGDRTLLRYHDNSGCGPNLKATEEAVRNLVLDSLKYWSRQMGVDGFRFDLAPVLGNEEADGFRFGTSDAGNIVNRAVTELPARSAEAPQGVDLIAEPWALGENTQQQGRFPDGWAEWNDHFRDIFRKAENKVGVDDITPGELADAFSGSAGILTGRGKKRPAPWHSVNCLDSHDEYCLRDLYSYNVGICWDHGGEPARQRQAVRNALAILMLSAGVPMIVAGDEFYRTLSGRKERMFSEDNDSVYLQWEKIAAADDPGEEAPAEEVMIYRFARNMIAFRHAHASLRPADFHTGELSPESGLRDISWHGADGSELGNGYWDCASNHFLGFRIDGKKAKDAVSSIYVCYNKGAAAVAIDLPANLSGNNWYRVCDTARWMEPAGNWETEGSRIAGNYLLADRSIAVFTEKPS